MPLKNIERGQEVEIFNIMHDLNLIPLEFSDNDLLSPLKTMKSNDLNNSVLSNKELNKWLNDDPVSISNPIESMEQIKSMDSFPEIKFSKSTPTKLKVLERGSRNSVILSRSPSLSSRFRKENIDNIDMSILDLDGISNENDSWLFSSPMENSKHKLLDLSEELNNELKQELGDDFFEDSIIDDDDEILKSFDESLVKDNKEELLMNFNTVKSRRLSAPPKPVFLHSSSAITSSTTSTPKSEIKKARHSSVIMNRSFDKIKPLEISSSSISSSSTPSRHVKMSSLARLAEIRAKTKKLADKEKVERTAITSKNTPLKPIPLPEDQEVQRPQSKMAFGLLKRKELDELEPELELKLEPVNDEIKSNNNIEPAAVVSPIAKKSEPQLLNSSSISASELLKRRSFKNSSSPTVNTSRLYLRTRAKLAKSPKDTTKFGESTVKIPSSPVSAKSRYSKSTGSTKPSSFVKSKSFKKLNVGMVRSPKSSMNSEKPEEPELGIGFSRRIDYKEYGDGSQY